MPTRKTSSLKAKPRKRSTTSHLSSRAQHLEKAILKIGKQYPELAGYVVLTKTPSKGHISTVLLAGDDGRCKRWAKDLDTGELVCIEKE